MLLIPFLRLLLLGAVLSTLAGCARAPIGFWSRNRFDQSELRHGPWRGYLDAREQHLLSKGRYRHGHEVGRWQYFGATGLPERTERFHGRSADLITLTLYHPNGQVAKRGKARYLTTAAADRFFWFGEWRCYDTTGRPLPSEFYVGGIRVGTPLVPPGN
ncbi:toxin-antitoxin system YwqK family antitoxin [Hymenobacter psychrophilus]|uniref:MORN repeat variant n=1 Tax=Hymenobacter psychrophilus TaxID=651662 RepID=A0A1H3GIY1_9BACT|nr:hypothetical protein [Hymenobacter psychrophilus]SDY02608.1 hypothetical protein SAMN04488069_10529 [Hymenobacter psychrophilus]